MQSPDQDPSDPWHCIASAAMEGTFAK
jgi:hypothetical protein